MSINADEYKSIVGLKNLYVAEVTADSDSAYTAGTPEYLAPAADARFSISASQDTQYADDQPYDVSTAIGDTSIELTVTAVPESLLAVLVGDKFDATTGRTYSRETTPPWYALGFQSLKSNGSYRYFWFLKVQFVPGEESMATKADRATPQPVKLIAKAVKTKYKFTLGGGVTDSVKRVKGDEDTDTFSGTDWFTQVQVPGVASPASLALSSSDPTDGASSVAVNKTITLTFNNALPSDAINNVIVSKADGTLVVCTNSLDTTKKIMTVNPDSDLDASSTYIVAIGVSDIYGDTLAAVVNFGTA